MLPQPMMPSVLAVISTPMKRFFSHLPAWVEASAAGIWRASANIMAMACSAVVIELPNGRVHHDDAAAVAAGMSTLSTPMPARPTTFSRVAAASSLGGHLGGRADGEAVIVADDGGEFVLAVEAGLDVDLDAALLEDRDGGGGELVGDENAGSHGTVLRLRDVGCGRPPGDAACDGRRGPRSRSGGDVRRSGRAWRLGLRPSRRPSRARASGRDIGRLHRGAAPDAQARRRVAIGADVVGDALLLEQAGQLSWRSRPARRPAGAAIAGSTTFRQTQVLERIVGVARPGNRPTASWPTQSASAVEVGVGARDQRRRGRRSTSPSRSASM